MENKQNKNEVSEQIRELIKPIFDKVLQETGKNRMSVGGSVGQTTPYIIYHPHNYRLYFDFDKSSLRHKPTPGGSVITPFKIRNSKELTLKNFNGCNLTIKKNCMEIRNFIEKDKKFRLPIQTGTIQKLIDIDKNKVNQSINILISFINKYGGNSNYSLLGIWHEYKYWHESFIDSLPQKMRWHTSISKKVYRDGEPSNIELWDGTYASNYVDSRALDSQVPMIEAKLDDIRALSESSLKSFTEAIDTLKVEAIVPLTTQIKLHLDVMENINQGIRELRYSLRPPINIIDRINSVQDAIKYKGIIKELSQDLKDKISNKLFD